MEEARRLGHREGLEDRGLTGGRLGPLMDLSCRPDQAPQVQLVVLPGEAAPGLAGGGLGDPDQEERQPAEQDWARMRSSWRW